MFTPVDKYRELLMRVTSSTDDSSNCGKSPPGCVTRTEIPSGPPRLAQSSHRLRNQPRGALLQTLHVDFIVGGESTSSLDFPPLSMNKSIFHFLVAQSEISEACLS